jgi:hypothetical protein
VPWGPYLFPPLGGWGNPAWPWNYSSGVPVIDLEAHKGKALLLRAQVKDVTNVVTFGPLPPAGVMEDLTWSWRGALTTVWPGATIERSSRGDDTPANTYVGDTLETSVNFGRMLFSGADPRNNSTTTEGVIELTDPRGYLENLFQYSWDGALLTFYRGDEKAPLSTFGEVAQFTGAILMGDLDKKSIRTRDLGWKLEGLIHDERYDGLGGLGGGEALQGKWKPYGAGYFFNVEPVPVDATNEVFQWCWTPSQTVIAIKHGGVVLTISADYPTYEDLIAAAIPLGQCATCKANSIFRTNFDIEFGLRVDALGDSNTLLGHITPEIRSEIARRIATGYGESKLNEVTEVDVDAFAKVAQDHPEEVGFWWGEETTKAAALNEIMVGILGYWHVRPNGQLAIGYMGAQDPELSFGEIEYGDYGMDGIEILDETIPWPATLMGWRRNYAPQARDQLAGSVQVDEETAAILGTEFSAAVSSDSSVNQMYPTAKPATIMGNYLFEVDAVVGANRIQALMGVPRRRYGMNMEIDAFADIVDRMATFVNFNRLKLGASYHLTCVGIDSNGFGKVTTHWWG